MPSKQVTIQGVMTWDDTPPPGERPPGVPTHPIYWPPGIWGPNDPRPTPPIANVPPGSNPNPPGWGAHPEHPIYNPPGIWGPPGPWPTPPISGIPGLPGYEPPLWPGYPGKPPGIWGGAPIPWPTPPIYYPPGIWGPNDPRPTHPISGIPGLPGYEPPRPPVNLPPGGSPIPPAAGVPIDGKLVWVPGYGYVFIPDSATEPGPPGEKPPIEGGEPHPDHTLPGDLPEK